MNLFGFFRKKTPSSAELRSELFSALAAGDSHAADALWFKHGPGIKACFTAWLIVPGEVRRDAQAHAAYQASLRAAAEFLAAKGEPQFVPLVDAAARGTPATTGAGGAEPVADPERAWELAVLRAQQLVDDQEYQAAIDLLTNLSPEILEAQGYAADACRYKTAGLLGVAHFRLGRKAEAMRYTKEALAECQRLFHQPGIELYTAQLNKISVDYRHRS
jgi:tetratricopeptide (TPR) repeat protein